MCWAWRCMGEVMLQLKASCHLCQAWGHSKGTVHAEGSHHLPGPADLGEFLRKIVAWTKAASEAQLQKEPRAICELGGTWPQEITRVVRVVFTRLMPMQIWPSSAPVLYEGRAQHRDNGSPHPEATQLIFYLHNSDAFWAAVPSLELRVSVCGWLSLCVGPIRVQLAFQQPLSHWGEWLQIGGTGLRESPGWGEQCFLINADSYLTLPAPTGCMRVEG